jgi:hypothetical protein
VTFRAQVARAERVLEAHQHEQCIDQANPREDVCVHRSKNSRKHTITQVESKK